MPSELHDPLKVITDALTEEIQDEPSVIEKEDGEQQHEAQTEAKLAQTPDAQPDTGDGGNGRQHRDAPNDDHLKDSGMREAVVSIYICMSLFGYTRELAK